jgi:hypothetical protein
MRKQRSQALKARKPALRTPNRALQTSRSSKSTICMSCPHSKQAPNERKRGIRVCRKCNRLISNIIRDIRFTCPLGQWANIT